MLGRPIAATALGEAGLGRLTADIGRTRFAEILSPAGEARSGAAEPGSEARADPAGETRATRP